MKKFALIVIVMIVMVPVFSQGAAPLSKGGKQLNLGLGSSSYGLPVYAGIDFAFHNDWTAGPVVKLVIDNNKTGFAALGRVDYHWNRLLEIPSNWDFYLGANVGVISGDEVNIDLGLQIGGRWYWNEKWGLNLEAGGGNGYNTSLGVSMRF